MRSEVGNGTTLTVRLAACTPVYDETRAAPPDRLRLDVAAKSGRRVLVAEDEDAIREMLTEALRHRGYIVECATDTQAACDIVRQAPVDLVITDLMMPGGGGRIVLAAVQALPEPPAILVVTGRVEDHLVEDLVASGVSACLRKPFGLRELLQVVEELLPARV